MRTSPLVAAVLALAFTACQSTRSPEIHDVDPEQREIMFSAVSSLAGKWQGEEVEGQASLSVFEVTSRNSVVRETMLPGTENEMTNMYSLDGNDLVMTHYCAGGNQPTMRATSFEDDQLVFHFEDVRDLKAADEVYMGELTIVFVDDNTIEQHWRALSNGEANHDMVMVLERVQ